MSRVFITGSSDGLGQMAAQLLLKNGHQVVLHARNKERARDAMAAARGAETIITGDLSSIAETKEIAVQVNRLEPLDAVIHNAGTGYKELKRNLTVDGLPHVFAINSLAPYILTSLINRPKRLIYISSGLHRDGDDSLKDLEWKQRAWNGFSAYADSKLHNIILAFAVARIWPGTLSNALEPGWVATKMGGADAPDSLEEAPETQVWLATSNDKACLVTGKYFYHKKVKQFHPAVIDEKIQKRFLAECERLSGVSFPGK